MVFNFLKISIQKELKKYGKRFLKMCGNPGFRTSQFVRLGPAATASSAKYENLNSSMSRAFLTQPAVLRDASSDVRST